MSRIVRELLFWLAWIIIPFTVEIIPSVRSYFIVVRKRMKDRRKQRKRIGALSTGDYAGDPHL